MQTELFKQEEEDTPIFNVSDLTREVRKTLEHKFSQIWIRGEISNLRSHSSGHFYFILKDSKSQLKAVLFRGDAMGLSYMPKEGDECLVFGDITVYEARGDYQIRVKHLMQDGMGSLRAKFEKLKNSLMEEGLFDESRKKALPSLPQKIGVVTSLTGAALQDFLSILKRREWGGSLFLFNSSVQGREAPAALHKAIQKAMTSDIQLLVITRGGGSLEDLWAFNDENLVRLLAGCNIPTISAIGHQTDFVLTDFVADLRAETPSGAAEWISSAFLAHRESVDEITNRFLRAPKYFFSQKIDRLDFLKVRLESSSPISQIERQHQHLDEVENRLKTYLRHRKERMVDKIQSLDHRLTNCSLQSTLKKGYTYLKNEEGKILSKASSLQNKAKIIAHFSDGSRKLRVED